MFSLFPKITNLVMKRRKRELLKEEDKFISKINITIIKYRTATAITSAAKETTTTESGHKELIIGPQRVLPGRLSVCRTFGDLEAKITAVGGNP